MYKRTMATDTVALARVVGHTGLISQEHGRGKGRR
jgi:hypothetical protein